MENLQGADKIKLNNAFTTIVRHNPHIKVDNPVDNIHIQMTRVKFNAKHRLQFFPLVEKAGQKEMVEKSETILKL